MDSLVGELQRSNALLRSAIDNLTCGLSAYDAGLVLIAHNAKLSDLLRLPPGFLVDGQTRFDDLIEQQLEAGDYGEGQAALDQAALYKRLARERAVVSFERTRRDGRVLEISSALTPEGGFVVTFTEQTERHRAQAAAAKSDELLRSAMNVLDEAFVLFDPQERLVFCNDHYRKMLAEVAHLLVPGAAYEDIVRSYIALSPGHEARGREDAWMARRLAQLRAGDTRSELLLGDGRWARLIERRMPTGHTACFRVDISDLMLATQAAEKASEAKSQFLANMSHEIRTPMNAVLGMLTLLQKTMLSPRQQDYAAKAEGAARSLLGLLNDILDFSKVEAGKLALDPQPLRMDELLRELSVILSANVGRKSVELLFDVDASLPPIVLADALRLQQVLINLAGNAIKFTEAGEVIVGVQVLAQDAANVRLEIAVSDTGIGIAPEHQQRIFAGFTQAEASTTRRFGGTGLGLAISRHLVSLMGGELQLQSAPGQGSRFSFQIALPVVAETRLPQPARAPLRALLVDDNASAREVLGTMAQSFGWQVDTAASGEAALVMVAEARDSGAPYEVVLVDWAMPGMDGWQTSQGIRRLTSGHAAMPVLVMVTAHGREVLAQRSEQEHGLLDGFLVKPVTASMLHDAVMDARHAGPRSDGHRGRTRAAAKPGDRLAGLRLLVVEDNPNNQQVARELLEDEGAEVVLAAEGQQALSLLAQARTGRRIDAVLMDVQMPVMDGYTATRLIRRQLQLDLPIIAMTANAMASERQACLDAGMNEHVGKPFDIDHLVAVLQRLCMGAVRATLQQRARIELPPAVLELARSSGIELAEALERLSGKVDLFERMVSALGASAADADASATSLHGFRGLAATLGAHGLAALAALGERALQAGGEPPEGWRVEFAAALRRDLAALTELARQLPRPAEEPLPPLVDLAPGLARLTELLEASDMAALEVFEGLRPQLLPAQADTIAQALARLDFAEAADSCRGTLERLT